MKKEQKIFMLVLILLLIGMIMLFSSSSFIAYQNKNFNNDPFFFFRKQLIYIVLGIICMFIAKSIPLAFIKRSSVFLMLASTVLLIAVLFLGPEINGARRWLKIGVFTFQPSEFAELSIIIFLSSLIADIKRIPKKSLITSIIINFIVIVLIFFEPNISTAILLGIITFTMLMISEIPKSYAFIPLSALAVTGAAFIPRYAYAIRRIMSYLNRGPISPQTQASLLAMGNGGILGEGLGLGKLKLLFIPEAYSDFIFSIIGEELGFLGALIIVIIFFWLFYEGINVSKRAYSPFNKILAFGISFLIFFKALIHISISLKILPTTGLGLPFISYGGSSILMNMIAIGLLINVAKNEKKYA